LYIVRNPVYVVKSTKLFPNKKKKNKKKNEVTSHFLLISLKCVLRKNNSGLSVYSYLKKKTNNHQKNPNPHYF